MDNLRIDVDYLLYEIVKAKKQILNLQTQIANISTEDNDNEDTKTINVIRIRLGELENNLKQIENRVSKNDQDVSDMKELVEKNKQINDDIVKDLQKEKNRINQIEDIRIVNGEKISYKEIGELLSKVQNINPDLYKDLKIILDTGRISIKNHELWQKYVNDYIDLVNTMTIGKFTQATGCEKVKKMFLTQDTIYGEKKMALGEYFCCGMFIPYEDLIILNEEQNKKVDGSETNEMKFSITISNRPPMIFKVKAYKNSIDIFPEHQDLDGYFTLGKIPDNGINENKTGVFKAFTIELMKERNKNGTSARINMYFKPIDLVPNMNEESVQVLSSTKVGTFEANWLKTEVKIMTFDAMANDHLKFFSVSKAINAVYSDEDIIKVLSYKKSDPIDQLRIAINYNVVFNDIKLQILRYQIVTLSYLSLDGKIKQWQERFVAVDSSLLYIKQYQLAFTAYVNKFMAKALTYGTCTIVGVQHLIRDSNVLTVTSNLRTELNRAREINVSVCDTSQFKLDYPDPPKLGITKTATSTEDTTYTSYQFGEKYASTFLGDTQYQNGFVYNITYKNDVNQLGSATLIGGVQMNLDYKSNDGSGIKWDVNKVYLKSSYRYNNKANFKYGWIDGYGRQYNPILTGTIECKPPEVKVWAFLFDESWILTVGSVNTLQLKLTIEGEEIKLTKWAPREWIFANGLKVFGLFCEVSPPKKLKFGTDNDMKIKIVHHGFESNASDFRVGDFGRYNKVAATTVPIRAGTFKYTVRVVNDKTNQVPYMECDTRCDLMLNLNNNMQGTLRFESDDASIMSSQHVIYCPVTMNWLLQLENSKGAGPNGVYIEQNDNFKISIKGTFISPNKPVQLVGISVWNETLQADHYLIQSLIVFTQYISEKVDALYVRYNGLIEMYKKANNGLATWAGLLNTVAIVAFPFNPLVGSFFMLGGSLISLGDGGLNIQSILNVVGNAIAFHQFAINGIARKMAIEKTLKEKLNIGETFTPLTDAELLALDDDDVIFDRSEFEVDITKTIVKEVWIPGDEEEIAESDDALARRLLLDPTENLARETKIWNMARDGYKTAREWLESKLGIFKYSKIENINEGAFELFDMKRNPFGIIERVTVPLEDARIKPLGLAYNNVEAIEKLTGVKDSRKVTKMIRKMNLAPEHSFIRASWLTVDGKSIPRDYNGEAVKHTLIIGVADFQKLETVAGVNAGTENMGNVAGKFVIAEKLTFKDGKIYNREYDFSKSYMSRESLTQMMNRELSVSGDEKALKSWNNMKANNTISDQTLYEILCERNASRYLHRPGSEVINVDGTIAYPAVRTFLLKYSQDLTLNYNLFDNNCHSWSEDLMKLFQKGVLTDRIKTPELEAKLLEEVEKYEVNNKTITDMINLRESHV